MHFLYVDESGDSGDKPGASGHFILSALLIHHVDRQEAKVATLGMRQRLQDHFGLPLQAELHASEFLGRNERHLNLPWNLRYRCALHAVGFLLRTPTIVPLRVTIEKSLPPTDAYGQAWKRLLELASQHRATRSAHRCDSSGLIVVGGGHRAAPRHRLLHGLHAELRDDIIDLPFGLDSRDSQFLQLADLLAYLTKQEECPSKAFRDAHSRRIIARMRRLFAVENP
jgi:Protein of unknown function (DUF3800)